VDSDDASLSFESSDDEDENDEDSSSEDLEDPLGTVALGAR
jgi:hypothetical protein